MSRADAAQGRDQDRGRLEKARVSCKISKSSARGKGGALMEAVEKMMAIWKKLFALDEMGADADFFSLGGDSMAATALMLYVEDAFGILLDPMEVFETPGLEEFALKVQAAAASTEQELIL
jgi:acyl carrier protein